MSLVLLIYGPTGAGKSVLASALARKLPAGQLDGEIINADSMQVYREISLLSAQPNRSARLAIPHHLYGHIAADQAYSVGQWRTEALDKIESVLKRKRLPIIVGGTGLYFRALAEGISAIPEIDDSIRQNLRSRLEQEGAEALHHALSQIDPVLAKKLPVRDSQRIMRGLEVYEATHIPLSVWQAQTPQPPKYLNFIKTILEPPQKLLDQAVELRLHQMLQAGLLDEVASLKALDLPPYRSALKALGFAAFSDHLDHKLSLDDAIHQAFLATRRYIRRQRNWARNQMADYIRADSASRLGQEIIARLK